MRRDRFRAAPAQISFCRLREGVPTLRIAGWLARGLRPQSTSRIRLAISAQATSPGQKSNSPYSSRVPGSYGGKLLLFGVKPARASCRLILIRIFRSLLGLEPAPSACISSGRRCALAQQTRRAPTGARCLVPSFDGAFFSRDSKDALWDKFYTAAPPRRRRSVEQYKIVKRA